MKMSSENIFFFLGATLNSWIFAKIDFRRTSGLKRTIQQQSRGDLCSINIPQFLPSAFLTNGSFYIQITFLFLETTNKGKKEFCSFLSTKHFFFLIFQLRSTSVKLPLYLHLSTSLQEPFHKWNIHLHSWIVAHTSE